MQIVDLSDHPGDMLRGSEKERNRALLDEARGDTARRHANEDLERARREKGFWRRLLSVTSDAEQEALERVGRIEAQIDEARSRVKAMNGQVGRQKAGKRSEDSLVEGLGSLPDDWILYRGYHNARGETDAVLVGPCGLWAIEVKNYNARLMVDGEEWLLERVDKRGRVYRTESATDRRGRTWARQVTDISVSLERWLLDNDVEVTVRTAVVLMNDHAEIVRCRNPGVDFIGIGTHQLLRAVSTVDISITGARYQKIVDLVRSDHERHEARRRARAKESSG